MRVEEVVIRSNSHIANKTLADSHIHQKTGLQVLAFSSDGADENFIYNPRGTEVLIPGSVIVFVGSEEQRRNLATLVGEG